MSVTEELQLHITFSTDVIHTKPLEFMLNEFVTNFTEVYKESWARKRTKSNYLDSRTIICPYLWDS